MYGGIVAVATLSFRRRAWLALDSAAKPHRHRAHPFEGWLRQPGDKITKTFLASRRQYPGVWNPLERLQPAKYVAKALVAGIG